MGWRTYAACCDADPELFFTPGEDYGAPAVVAQVTAARAVCQSCPVRAECLTWAVTASEGHGLWAGLTPDERREIARERQDGIPHPEIDAEPMCPACDRLFLIPAVDGDVCDDCVNKVEAA